MTSPMDEFSKQLKTSHHSAYLASLLAPDNVCDHMQALYAFNHEIEQIRTTVSEEIVGMIRLQWWRDAIEAIYQGTVRNHQLVEALARAIEVGNWPHDVFERFFTAHEQDYSAAPFQTMQELLTYCDHTYGSIYRLQTKLYQCHAQPVSDMVTFLARTEALCYMLRSLPVHVKEGWCVIPEALLVEQQLSSEILLSGKAELLALEPVIQALVKEAEQHYERANQQKRQLSKAQRKMFRQAALLPSQIKACKQRGAGLLESPVTLSPAMTPLRLWWGW